MCRRTRAASKAFAKKQKAVLGPQISVEDMNIAFFALVTKTARDSRLKILRDVRRERIRRLRKADPVWQNLNLKSYPDDLELDGERYYMQNIEQLQELARDEREELEYEEEEGEEECLHRCEKGRESVLSRRESMPYFSLTRRFDVHAAMMLGHAPSR